MNPTILFVDSGVGGLSVYQEAKKLLPDYHYLYCFDNGGFPYSEKSEDVIVQRVVSICDNINQQYPLDMIVVACNTASTVALPALRQRFDIPVVGTVPAIKPAAEQSQTKHIGLLATKGTVKRSYVDDLINKFAKNCKVERLGSTKLVEIAEQKLRGNPVDLSVLGSELADWQTMADLDTVILGCTHFPLIKDEIQACLPQAKLLVDSGYAIALRIRHLTVGIKGRSKVDDKNRIFSTVKVSEEYDYFSVLQQWGFDELLVIELS